MMSVQQVFSFLYSSYIYVLIYLYILCFISKHFVSAWLSATTPNIAQIVCPLRSVYRNVNAIGERMPTQRPVPRSAQRTFCFLFATANGLLTERSLFSERSHVPN